MPSESDGDGDELIERKRRKIKKPLENEASEHMYAHDVSTESIELQLLASDTEDEKAKEVPGEDSRLAQNAGDYYMDCRLDRGNLRVSTLYYPGRPQYEFRSGSRALGAGSARARRARRARRYFARRAPDPPDAAPAAERADHYRRRLARDPHDAALWESFVDFQEACAGADAALAAAEEGAARAPEARRLRTRLLAALRSALPPHAFLDRLRDMLASERSAARRTELWEWLLEALAAAPDGDPARLTSAAAAAVADTRSYPRLLHALGSQLAAAGLWERLVLLVELVVAMNLAADAFPRDSPAEVERRLQELEDEAVRSGLPLGAVWVRVESARGAAHWRPAPAGAAPADPQRAPLPHDVAELLLPVAAPDELLHLAVRLLMLAKVPLLPGTQWASAWAGRAPPHHAEALLPLLAAAGALPPAHRAHVPPEAARRTLRLLLDPPHYFADGAGYARWVDALWDACCARAAGDALVALLCWRLRWLAALLPLGERGEAARVRSRARALLRRTAHPLPFVEFARLERGAAGPARALHAAALALRAALQEPALPATHALHAARAVAELSADGAALSGAGRCALVCAALRRPPPAELAEPEPADVAAALDRCERECEAAEADADAAAGDCEPTAADVLLPARGEWARARALLAAPERRERLLRDVCAAAPRAVRAGGPAARYWEEAGAALVAAAAREGGSARAARLLLAHFPDSVQLALEAADAPLWAWAAAQGPAERLAALAPRGPVSALAALLPPLVRAVRSDFAAGDAERLVRAARRTVRAGAGALPWAVRLEAEARAPRPRLAPALYAALDAVPQAKWLYVRGAAWCGGEAAALADALLERQLRLHALPDELRPH